MSHFANGLKQLRIERGLTQSALAKELHVTQNAVFNWENEKREPDYNSLKKMADLFGTSVDYLMGWKDEKVQPPTDEKLDRNVILISGRDGSRYEYEVSDGHKELVKQVLDNLKPTEDERM